MSSSHQMEAHIRSKSGDETGYDSSCSSCISTTLVGDTRRSCISDISFGSSRSVSANSYAASTISTSSSSCYSSSTAVAHKPHKANQAEWETIRSCTGSIGLDHFRLVRRLGSGDLGNVYLCRLRDPRLSGCLYAMKVVDKEALAIRKKLERAETEKEILSMLDHPFLPTLYADFEAAHYSCIVMEFCPGGDLHAARQRQPRRRFSLSAVRFYATEILLALEYLHMMGVVYRDLKPENVLVRADGHIMLSDFDLSFKCEVVPKLLRQKRTYDPDNGDPKNTKASVPSCVPPIQPVLSCLLGRKSLKKKSPPASAKEEGEDDEGNEDRETREMDPELVAEPISARSRSFVGTHEYLAPEVISGLGHGSAVDWWTLGVFLYELLYGRTPFKGENNEKTLVNIVKQALRFPRTMSALNSSTKEMEEMSKAQDLISKLLAKNPRKRIGSQMGSVEIKKHDFFKGTNWALVRSVRPPEVPVDLQKILHANKSTTLVRHKQHLGRNVGRETKACANIHNSYHIDPHHFDYF